MTGQYAVHDVVGFVNLKFDRREAVVSGEGKSSFDDMGHQFRA